jgi:protein-S-isoprenylcysteine O-methyltransferase Ste14
MKDLVYLFHGIFWSTFLLRFLPRRTPEARFEVRPETTAVHKTRRAWPALIVHSIGFGAMYSGIDWVMFAPLKPKLLFALPPAIGASAILAGAAILAWALVVFDSWRILAKLDQGHRLCTRGPFRYVRNPIYLACDLLALGSFLWLPNEATLVGFVFMHLGGELRARAEEKVLTEAFGDDYRRYRESTGRFLPRFG